MQSETRSQPLRYIIIHMHVLKKVDAAARHKRERDVVDLPPICSAALVADCSCIIDQSAGAGGVKFQLSV